MNPFKEYFADIWASNKKLLFWPLRKLESSSNDATAITARNFRLSLRGRKHRFSKDERDGLFVVVEASRKHYFGNLQRGLGLYANGISRRAVEIFDSYLLGGIDFNSGDIVIDCGANYGDLWLALQDRILPKDYIAFEPGELEFRSLEKNAPGALLNNVGLGPRDEFARFYVNELEADSSFIEPREYTEIKDIATISLDGFFIRHGLERVKLLKLEAEGYEPEILEGATMALEKIDYVAIDGGFERGRGCEETFSTQVNFLLRRGFIIVGVNFRMARALLKRDIS